MIYYLMVLDVGINMLIIMLICFCQEKGYLPASLLNFVALLGWAPPNGQEIMTLSQMIEAFSLCHINKVYYILSAYGGSFQKC